MSDIVFQNIVIRSTTPRTSHRSTLQLTLLTLILQLLPRKVCYLLLISCTSRFTPIAVNFWFQGMSDAPPSRPPSAHNSEFDLPAMDPAEWKPPTMDEHTHFAPTPNRGPIIIAGSPVRSNATARLNDELNEGSPSVPDYGAVPELEERIPSRQPSRQPSRAPTAQPSPSRAPTERLSKAPTEQQPSRQPSVAGDPEVSPFHILLGTMPMILSPKVRSPDPRHFSYESWGNLGDPRESTFGPMLIKVSALYLVLVILS